MKNKSFGFTILELVIVIVIIGILATLGLASFSAPREQSIEKEAIGNLKLMAAAEKIYRMENAAYIGCANTAAVNTNLRLMFPTNDPNWKYRVVGISATNFSARAQRTSGFFTGNKRFCINATRDTPDTNTSNCGAAW